METGDHYKRLWKNGENTNKWTHETFIRDCGNAETIWIIENKKSLPETVETTREYQYINTWDLYQRLWNVETIWINENKKSLPETGETTREYQYINTWDLNQRLWKRGDNLSKCTQKTFTRDCGYVERIRINEHIRERWWAGVETQKNVRGEIGGWGRVPFNETYAPSLSTIYDGA